MLTFAPVSRTDGYVTLTYTDLCERYDYDARVASLQAALAAGDLIAHVQVEGDKRFWRVPREHWNRLNSGFEGEPADELFCWGSSDVPVQFRDRALLFFLDDVEAWEADEPASTPDDMESEQGGVDLEDEWLSSQQLLERNPNPQLVERRLRQLFEHGLLRIKARSAKLKVRWRDRAESDWIIPSSNFGDLGSAYKSFSIDLFHDTLLATVRTRTLGNGPDSTINAIGLSFSRRDIVAGLPDWQRAASTDEAPADENASGAGASSQTSKDKGGAPTDSVKWANLVAVVGAIFANADLVPGSGPPKRAALRNMIDDYAARVGLPIASKGTIDPAIDLLIKIAWAEHDGGQPLMAADGHPLKIDSNVES